MSLHSDTLSWIRANQSINCSCSLEDECLAEKQQISILLSFGLTRPGLEPTIYHTRDEYTNHYTTYADPLAMKNYLLLVETFWREDNSDQITCISTYISYWNSKVAECFSTWQNMPQVHLKWNWRWKHIRNFFEWVTDCCLMPTQQFFSYIMARTS